MSCIPQHGRLNCNMCYDTKQVVFDKTKQTEENWRITANPLAWGNQQAEVIVLGFSKGPTQSGALENTPHDKIAYKGNRLNVGKILAHVGLLEKTDSVALKNSVDKAIADKNSRFHFGSLIRCTVEQYDSKKENGKAQAVECLINLLRYPLFPSNAPRVFSVIYRLKPSWLLCLAWVQNKITFENLIACFKWPDLAANGS